MGTLDEIFAERDRAPGEQGAEQHEVQAESPAPQGDGVAAVADTVVADGEASEGAGAEGGDNRADGLQNALHAERQKTKRYTEQVAEFQRELAEQKRLLEERDRQWAARFEQLTAAVQPQREQPKRPSLFEADDVDAEIEARIQARIQEAVSPIAVAQERNWEKTSLRFAVKDHGAEAVRSAYSALEDLARRDRGSAQAVYQYIMSSEHPYGALVEWDNRQRALAEIGDDPAAFKEKVKAELLAELQASTGTQQRAAPPQATIPATMPSNFATGRNVGARSGPGWSGPASIDEIFDMRNKRGR